MSYSVPSCADELPSIFSLTRLFLLLLIVDGAGRSLCCTFLSLRFRCFSAIISSKRLVERLKTSLLLSSAGDRVIIFFLKKERFVTEDPCNADGDFSSAMIYHANAWRFSYTIQNALRVRSSNMLHMIQNTSTF